MTGASTFTQDVRDDGFGLTAIVHRARCRRDDDLPAPSPLGVRPRLTSARPRTPLLRSSAPTSPITDAAGDSPARPDEGITPCPSTTSSSSAARGLRASHAGAAVGQRAEPVRRHHPRRRRHRSRCPSPGSTRRPVADEPAAGAEVVVVGSVRRRFFRAGGATQSRTEVVAEQVVAARRGRDVRRPSRRPAGCCTTVRSRRRHRGERWPTDSPHERASLRASESSIRSFRSLAGHAVSTAAKPSHDWMRAPVSDIRTDFAAGVITGLGRQGRLRPGQGEGVRHPGRQLHRLQHDERP